MKYTILSYCIKSELLYIRTLISSLFIMYYDSFLDPFYNYNLFYVKFRF